VWGEVLLRTPVVSRCTQLPAVCWPACPFLVLLSCIGVPLCLDVFVCCINGSSRSTESQVCALWQLPAVLLVLWAGVQLQLQSWAGCRC
jgi:hypothetical protein